jgi:DNA-binding MarR family transcriptional regulator
MEDERQALMDHFLEVGRQFMHRNLQLGGERQWAELDLTMSQLKVLFVLVSLGRATMSQIARDVGMTLSTATGVADRLVAQGLVRRVNDPDDRRLVWLHPTAAATALVDRLIQVGETQLRVVARHLSFEELSLVVRAQDLLCEAMLRITSEELAAAEGEVRPIIQRSRQEQEAKR